MEENYFTNKYMMKLPRPSNFESFKNNFTPSLSRRDSLDFQ